MTPTGHRLRAFCGPNYKGKYVFFSLLTLTKNHSIMTHTEYQRSGPANLKEKKISFLMILCKLFQNPTESYGADTILIVWT